MRQIKKSNEVTHWLGVKKGNFIIISGNYTRSILLVTFLSDIVRRDDGNHRPPDLKALNAAKHRRFRVGFKIGEK